jgi:hypothetical protein
MSLRNVVVPAVFSALAILAGCGGNGSIAKVNPPPGGAFSTSNLNGTYVFSITGNVNDTASDFMAMTGTFAANGSGTITGGALDINSTAFTSAIINNPITGGSYSISADGRGKATLNTSTPLGSSITVAFVLSSSAHGLITQFDSNGSGSGSFDLQTSTSQPAAGRYVLGLSGISSVSATTGAGIPAGAAAIMNLDGNGNANAGTMDYNDNGTPSLLTINSGSTVLSGTSPGTITLLTSSGTLNFDVYPVDETHLKVIEVDGFPILSGDLFAQSSSAFPSGQIVFTMAGVDNPGGGVPLAVGGFMTSDGSSTISGGSEDYNDGGATDTSPLAFSGAIQASNNRYLLQLNNFENGENGALGTFTFAAYPSDGGIQLIEIDGNGVTSGVGFAQTSTALASGAGYGFGLSAVNQQSREDDIAEFTTTSNSFKGIIDYNDQGSTSYRQSLNGTYTPDSPATGAGVLTANTFSGVYYTVDSSNVLFIELDSTQLGLGALQVQSASANSSARSNLAAAHLAMLRSTRANAKKAWRAK